MPRPYPYQSPGRAMTTRNDLERHRRRSMRLTEYDYSRAGAYFVTICAHRRLCEFGKVEQAEMQLNAVGRIVVSC